MIQVTIHQLTGFRVHTVADIAIETSQGTPRLITYNIIIDYIRRLRIIIHFLQFQLRQFIPVERNIEIRIPSKCSATEVLRTDRKFKTLVHHFTFVSGYRSGCGSTGRQRYIHQHILCFLIVVVRIER